MWMLRTILICTLFAVISCSDSTGPGSGDDTNGTVLVTSNIGPEGGTVGTEEIQLTIQPGAFASEQDVDIVMLAEQYESDDCVTATYSTTNIPSDYSAPMEIALKINGELSGDSFMAVGLPMLHEDGTERRDIRLLPAEQDGNFLVATIPPLATTVVAGTKPVNGIAEYLTLAFFGLTDRQVYYTPEGHVRMVHPLKYIDIVPTIGSLIETSYAQFQSMGFHYTLKGVTYREFDRIEAYIKKFYYDKEDYTWAYTNFDSFRDDDPYGYVMRINEQKLSANDGKLKESIGRDIFSFQFGICNPDGNESMYWFNRAAKTWVGELTSGSSEYVPDEFHNNEILPFKGLAYISYDWNANSDYYTGMAAFVEYLCDSKYTRQTLVDIYDSMWNGAHSIEALEDGIGHSSDEWWPGFVKAYLAGSVYNVSTATFLNNIDGTFTINTKDDTLKTFSGEYGGLSAQLYRINLDYDDIDENSTITFSVDAGNATVLIYGIKGNVLEYFDEAPEIEITNIKDLTEAGYDLLAVVTHYGYSTNLTDVTDIALRVARDAAPPLDLTDYNYCYVSVYYFTCHYSDGETNNICNYSWQVGGAFDGNVWRGSGTSHISSETTVETAITVNVDFDTMTATDVTASYHIYGDIIDTEYSIRAHDIPLYELYPGISHMSFDLRGTDTKDSIDYLTYDSDFQTLATFETPREDSGLRVQIYFHY